MAEVVVTYSVPVCVHVDTESGKVERVVVVTEEVRPSDVENDPVYYWPFGYPDGADVARVSEEEAERAVTVAESDEWPEWEWGY